jgi:hypothetical protein
VPGDLKLAMFEILNEKEKMLKENDRARMGKMFGQSVMLEFKINQFVTKLRKKIAARKEFARLRDENMRENELMKVDPTERFEIETNAVRQRGDLEVSFNSIPKDFKNTKMYWEDNRLAEGFFSFTRKFFHFVDDV